MVLPFELTFNTAGRPWEDFYRDRAEWLTEHGVDPDDRAAVAAVDRESRRAYGVVDSLSRARVMAQGKRAHARTPPPDAALTGRER